MPADLLMHVIAESVEVTGFVAGMMCAIEAVNVLSGGRLIKGMRSSGLGQIAVSSALGATPGCVGGYAVTSMYSHGMVSYGALLAMMVATCGDEAFVMLAMFPKTALIIFASLLVAGIGVGVVVDMVRRRLDIKDTGKGHCHEMESSEKPGLKQFLKENLLHHVILHHVPKIFLWTFGTLLALGIAESLVDIESWVSGNTALVILIAAAVGLIPQSGPHMVFVTLFASGTIPLPVLLASCISQDGHASLPLLADDRRTFLTTKLATFVLAVIVGYISYFLL